MNLVYILGNQEFQRQVVDAVSFYIKTTDLHPVDLEHQTYFMIFGNPSLRKKIRLMLTQRFICPDIILESLEPYDIAFETRYIQSTIYIHHSIHDVPDHIRRF
jgi:hypothetical protein